MSSKQQSVRAPTVHHTSQRQESSRRETIRTPTVEHTSRSRESSRRETVSTPTVQYTSQSRETRRHETVRTPANQHTSQSREASRREVVKTHAAQHTSQSQETLIRVTSGRKSNTSRNHTSIDTLRVPRTQEITIRHSTRQTVTGSSTRPNGGRARTSQRQETTQNLKCSITTAINFQVTSQSGVRITIR